MESRSTFITILAWVFIVGAGLAAVVTMIQIAMVSAILTGNEYLALPEDAPTIVKLLLQYIYALMYGACAFLLLTFVCAIALLRRRNWGRLGLIVILAFGVVWQLGGLLLYFVLLADMTAAGNEAVASISASDQVLSVGLTLVLAGLCVWLIKRLASRQTALEFVPQPGIGNSAV